MPVTELDKLILTYLLCTPNNLHDQWIKGDLAQARAYLADVGFPDPDVGLQVLDLLKNVRPVFHDLAKTLQTHAGPLIPYPVGSPHPPRTTVKTLFDKIHQGPKTVRAKSKRKK